MNPRADQSLSGLTRPLARKVALMSDDPVVLGSFDDLVASVPYLFGAELKDSLVVFPTTSAPLARVDLTRDRQVMSAAAAALQRAYAPRRVPVVLLAYTDSRDLAKDACDQLTEALMPHSEVVAAIGVDHDRWVRLDRPGHGIVSASTWDRVGAEVIYRTGVHPFRSLEEHRDSFGPAAHPLPAQAVGSASSRAGAAVADPDLLSQERAWLRLTLERHVATATPLSDADAARLLADVQHIPLRDHAWATVPRGQTLEHAGLWKDVLTRAPAGMQAPPASLAAFCFWAAGDGMSARAALERVPPDQEYSMARLVAVAVGEGIDPRSFPMPSEEPDRAVSRTAAPADGQGHERRTPPQTPPSAAPGVSR